MRFVFWLIALILVVSAGYTLAYIVGGINEEIPAVVLGPLLCPPHTEASAPYVRSFGGWSGPVLQCRDEAGDVVMVSRGPFNLLWPALFIAPLLPFAYLHARGLRRHNYPGST